MKHGTDSRLTPRLSRAEDDAHGGWTGRCASSVRDVGSAGGRKVNAVVKRHSALVGRYETWLAPDPSSARASRRFVRTHLAEGTDADGWLDTAELLVSELVTNALLHARTSIGLAVNVFVDAVRVEVSDASPVLPVRSSPQETSTTGRGLEVVELLADDSGVGASSTGKVLWFSLGPAPAFMAESKPERRGGSADHSVVLSDAPLELFTVWKEHVSAAVRENMLMSFSLDPVKDSTIATALGGANDAVGGLLRAKPSSEYDERLARDRVDVRLEAAVGLASQFDDLRKVMERTGLLARDGIMLVPPAPPEVIQFRNWVCDEVTRQCDGAAPVPWPENTPDTAVSVVMPQLLWDVSDVAAASEALIAADDSNRILAVSPSAASLLGWRPHELVGERIIAIIPERLHETHIVGFLRFLLTGRQGIIGSLVTVPARRADATEISVGLAIRVLSRSGGRTAFIAELTAPGPGDVTPGLEATPANGGGGDTLL